MAMQRLELFSAMEYRYDSFLHLDPDDYVKAWATAYVEESERARMLAGV